MAYSDDIAALSPSNHLKLDGDLLATIGGVDGTNVGFILNTFRGISEDAVNSVNSNGVADRFTLPSATTVIAGILQRKAVGFWFNVSDIQLPFGRIYGEGDSTTSLSIIFTPSNGVIFEVDSGGTILQIYSDVVLTPNRDYHLYIAWSGDAFDNEFSACLDGLKQLDSDGVVPSATSLVARSSIEFADPSGNASVGGTAIVLVAPVEGRYNHYVSWGDVTLPTVAQVRSELFEKGAIAEVTIASDTEVNMQTALDVYSGTVRGNVPCCIRIEPVSGGGDLSLNGDNITFDPLSSIHVQYTGSDELTWVNTNGGDCSISSATNGGTVAIVNPATLFVSSLIAGSEIRFYEAGTTTELAGVESSGTLFSSSILVASVDIRILALGYQIKSIKAVDMTSGDVNVVAGQVVDRQYRNN